MPRIPIQLTPGIDAQSTPALGPISWNESQNVRFFQGLAQKAGGFQHFTDEVAGGGRPIELRAWAALSGISHLAIAGENWISMFDSDVVSNITPLTKYSPVPMPALSTTAGSQMVTISDLLDNPAPGDWVRIRAPVSVAGIVLDGSYEVTASGLYETLSATVNAPQIGAGSYTPGDVLTAVGGAGTEPTFTVTHTQAMGAINGGAEPTVLAGGIGGAPGLTTFTSAAGTGTPFQFTGTINGFGELVGPLTLTVPGDFTVNPPSLLGVPVTGGGLVGGIVTVQMGVRTVAVLTAGMRTAPVGPVATTVTPAGGTGATLLLTMGAVSHFTITAALKATATVVDGGTVRSFTTIAGSGTVTVGLADHGLFSGQVARVTDPVVVGGLTIEGNYIATVVDPDIYTIEAGTAATSSASVDENGGALALVFFNPSVGAQNTLEVEFVDLDNWGEFLLIIPQGGPVFVWMPLNGPVPATNVLTAPQANTSGFVSTQQQILVLCGSVNLATGLFDPMLVRWSDAGDYTQFVPLPSNQAGSFRLELGSMIVAGLAVAGRGLVWTDLGLYSMQYEGAPLVWGRQPIGVNCGLIGPKAMGVLGETVIWMSSQQFYVLAGGGSPQVIPCSVWDLVFKNIDKAYARESVCTTNAFFSEVVWYVPQTDGTTTKARLNIATGTWDYTIIEAGDTSDRSAGIDQNVFGPPLGASPEGVIYREETGTDANDEPLIWRMVTGIAQIAQGDQVAFFSQITPDIKFSNDQSAGPGTVKVLVYVYREPQAAPRVKGPYLINARTRTLPCRGRGRGLQFEFFGDDKGSSPRLGLISYRGQPDGRGG